jgi:hypothetical protein
MSISVTESEETAKVLSLSVDPGDRAARLDRPVLIVRPGDLPPEVKGIADSLRANTRALGGNDDQLQTLFDAIPAVIARRVRSITPKEFKLASVELELALDVAIPGIEVSGTVKISLEPG